MLNPLRRLTGRGSYVRPRIQPMPITPRDQGPLTGPTDDYHVEGHGETVRPSLGGRVVQGLQMIMLAVVAVLSFAVFWLVGIMLNLF